MTKSNIAQNIETANMVENTTVEIFVKDLLIKSTDNLNQILSSDNPSKTNMTSLNVKDLKPLANEATKKDILESLWAESLDFKVKTLDYLSGYESQNRFEKKELPYISRFVMYSIVSDILDILQTVFIEEPLLYNKTDSLEAKLAERGIWMPFSKNLLKLIEVNRKQYMRHFGEGYKVKMKLVEKVLRNIK